MPLQSLRALSLAAGGSGCVWKYCKQRVRVTRQRSGFWPAVRFGSVPNPAKYPTHCVLAGLLPGPDINPRLFGRVVPGPRFHSTVPATFTPITYLSSDRIMA